MTETTKTVAIVGAGIVGVSAAIWLQRAGHQVVLIDKLGPAGGASHGNAGLLAAAAVVPVPAPGLWRKAPGMLFSPDQPLFLRWSYLPKAAPFLMKYLAHGRADRVRQTAAALAPLLGDSLQDHQALAAQTGAERWIVPSDYLVVYKDRAAFEADAFSWAIRGENGYQWRELEGVALRDYDPAFSDDLTFAACLPGHGRITDPGAYVRHLASHVVEHGGRLIQAEVSDIARENGAVTGVRAGGELIPCDSVVLAAGAWSTPLARMAGVSVPMETERGYHIELWNPSYMPGQSSMIISGKFVCTPMEGRLRLAGVVEFGGLEAGPSSAPLDLLRRNIATAFPDLTWDTQTEWMGHRPVPASSVPVIGEAPAAKGLYLGFGHQHVGLTGGPKTGRLLAQMISGQRPNMDLSPYDPAQFSVGS